MPVRLTLPSFGVLRVELLAGLVVALALIPEAISFSLIAGVDPRVGLFASFTMAVTIAIVGGRPAMISAATGAMALVVVALVTDHGVEYLLAATILAGVIQIVLGLLGVREADALRAAVGDDRVRERARDPDLPRADPPPDRRGGALGYALVAVGLRDDLLLPRFTTAMPAPLVAIVVLTVVAWSCAESTCRTSATRAKLPDALPILGMPDVPFTLDTLAIIAPYSITLAAVGLLESLMTAQLVDDITETRSDKDRETRGQGIANIVTGFFGGMAGCAMIGQTMINVKASGARTRISTFCAGLFLLILVVGLGDIVAVIPMAALVAVMIFVSVATFDWHSIAPTTLQADAGRRDRDHARDRRRHGRDGQPGDRRRASACSPRWSLFARRVAHLGRRRARRGPRRRRPSSTPSPASCSSPPTRSSSTPSTSPAIRRA